MMKSHQHTKLKQIGGGDLPPPDWSLRAFCTGLRCLLAPSALASAAALSSAFVAAFTAAAAASSCALALETVHPADSPVQLFFPAE